MDLTLLPTPAAEPVPALVDLLERMLEKAYAGELDGAALVLSYPPGAAGAVRYGTVYVLGPTEDAVGFLGALELLKGRIVKDAT